VNAISAEGMGSSQGGMDGTRPGGAAPPRIAVINDYADFLEIVEAVLSEAGYDVAAFSGDDTTVDQVRATRPDLLIVDLTLAESEGRAWDLTKLQAVEELRHAAIVLCSADMHNLDDWAARWAGRDRVEILVKPFTIDQLLGCVGGLLDRQVSAAT
jgi:DNA-binding response OmpR family regulator